MKILVIEDDPTVGEFVRRGLEEQRWQADLCNNGLEGERMATAQPYDLIILDMRLPGRNGLDVLRSLRAKGFERPVLVLTAQDAVDAKVETLRAGADDYVTKPFAFEELLARAEALLRRPRAMASPQLRVGDLELDQGTREVRRADEFIELHNITAAHRRTRQDTRPNNSPMGAAMIRAHDCIVGFVTR